MSDVLNSERLQTLRSLLSAPRTVAIVTHHNPDGDAMGASLGLAHILTGLGHRVQVVLPNTPPPFLHWLPGYDKALAYDRSPEAGGRAMAAADLVFALDFNRPDRVKDLEPALRAARTVVVIDHHLDPDGFASLMFCDADACATSQMIVDLVSAMHWDETLDKQAAICLYTGLMTDTGSFRFKNVNAHTFRVAARLVDRGAVPHEAYDRAMDDNTEHRLRLLGFALSERMRSLPELNAVVFHLTAEDLRRFHYEAGDTEGLVNYGLSIQGIRLAAYFMERGDGVKISFRSKGMLPVNELAAHHFEGGGHRNAAGGRSSAPLADVIARFERLLPAFLEAHPE